jgi:hypothetical protein
MTCVANVQIKQLLCAIILTSYLRIYSGFFFNIPAKSVPMNTTGSLIGFGCLGLVMIGALVFMIQRSRRRRANIPPQFIENREALAMHNLAFS